MKYLPGSIDSFWFDGPCLFQSPFGKTIEVEGYYNAVETAEKL
jgi:hypothetical protein